jgi:hypothetical protein
MKEWHRTILLLIMLCVAVGFIFWQRSQYANNFLDTL